MLAIKQCHFDESHDFTHHVKVTYSCAELVDIGLNEEEEV